MQEKIEIDYLGRVYRAEYLVEGINYLCEHKRLSDQGV